MFIKVNILVIAFYMNVFVTAQYNHHQDKCVSPDCCDLRENGECLDGYHVWFTNEVCHVYGIGVAYWYRCYEHERAEDKHGIDDGREDKQEEHHDEHQGNTEHQGGKNLEHIEENHLSVDPHKYTTNNHHYPTTPIHPQRHHDDHYLKRKCCSRTNPCTSLDRCSEAFQQLDHDADYDLYMEYIASGDARFCKDAFDDREGNQCYQAFDSVCVDFEPQIVQKCIKAMQGECGHIPDDCIETVTEWQCHIYSYQSRCWRRSHCLKYAYCAWIASDCGPMKDAGCQKYTDCFKYHERCIKYKSLAPILNKLDQISKPNCIRQVEKIMGCSECKHIDCGHH